MIGAIVAGGLSAMAPPVTNSYESIATVSVPLLGQSTVTFSSIPSTYKHLQLRFSGSLMGGGVSWFQMRFNGDSGSSYSFHELRGNGSTASAAGGSDNIIYLALTDSTNPTVCVSDILDYANTNKYKTVRNLGGVDSNGSGYVQLTSASWRNTAAVNSIVINCGAGIIAQYSSFALYGIKG